MTFAGRPAVVPVQEEEDDVRLPQPRGEHSQIVIEALSQAPAEGVLPAPAGTYTGDAVRDEDAQLAMWVLYELHYLGFDEVDPEWQWHPDAVRYLGWLERPFLTALESFEVPATERSAPMHERIESLVDEAPSAGLARFMQREADEGQLREFLRLKSIYHLKESDPHSFVIPRLTGTAKVRLAELQYDEYGSGRPDRLHSALFEQTLRSADLDATYGTYIDQAPATTLAVNNAMSLFGLHRAHRGAAMGHLAAFEATSSIPCRRVAQGIRRLGLGDEAAAYYDEHVEADAVHEQIAMREICGTMTREDPELTDAVLFGVWTCLYLEYLDGKHIVDSWASGRSALRGTDATPASPQRLGQLVGAA